VNAIFGTTPIEDITVKEKVIYVNEARRGGYPIILISLPSSPGRPIYFSETDAYAVRFPHQDALVVTMHIGCCRMSKILVDGGGHALDWMDDTPGFVRKMILPQTQSLLYRFDGSEARSPRTVMFPIRADPYNVVTESVFLTSILPIMLSSGAHEFI